MMRAHGGEGPAAIDIISSSAPVHYGESASTCARTAGTSIDSLCNCNNTYGSLI